jgi:hypothetical protein
MGANKLSEDGIQREQWAAALDSNGDEQRQGGGNSKAGNQMNATIKLRKWWQRSNIALNSNSGRRRWRALDFWQGHQWWRHW